MPNPATRIRIAGGLFGLILLVIIGRLWWLQLTHWSVYYVERSLSNRTRVEYREAPRGPIYDRSGRVLAENREVWNLAVIPSRLPVDEGQLGREIAYIASAVSTEDAPVSTADVRKALEQMGRAGVLEAQAFDKIGRDLTFDQVATIEEGRIEHPAVTVTTSTIRHYPYGALAGHALGYVRNISKRQLERVKQYTYPADPSDPTLHDLGADKDYVYNMQSVFGQGGVEELCEMDASGDGAVPMLPGRRGRAEYEVDAALAPQRLIAERATQTGAEVWLTVDAQVQYAAEVGLRHAMRRMDANMGAMVVMDVRNGAVIALASVPCVDPNDWVRGLSKEQWAEASEDPGLPLLNKAIAGAYPPGSVFKIVSSCAAAETSRTHAGSTSHCAGYIRVGSDNQIFKCWTAEEGGHGYVDFVDAIAKSCNVFFYDCVRYRGLDPVQISKHARKFGLAQVTGLGLAGEVPGVVPAPGYGMSEADQQWKLGNSLNFVIGQDRLTVTPLQMAVACAAVANGGHVLTPNLVRRVRWPAYLHRHDTVSTVGKALSLGVKPETLALVRQGMRRAVTAERGTARSLGDLGMGIAGKTGSAQHIPGKPTHSWFIGFAPFDSPQYAVASFVACGGSGFEAAVPAAAPVFRALTALMPEVRRLEFTDEAYALPPPTTAAEVAEQRRRRMAEARARREQAMDRASEDRGASDQD